MWYVCDVLYAVLYVRVSCFVVRGCGCVSKGYIDVCYCDMFSVVNVYLDHLKFCVVCINSRRYVCCSECDVVSNESTSCLVQPIGAHCCDWRIPAHQRCTQCSILLHLMDICFLTCICLWQISQIQTCLFKVVGPGLVSTSPAFVRSSASHPAG